jgi:hypothetical protein
VVEDVELVLSQGEDWYWGIRWSVGKTRKTATPKEGIEDYEIVIQFREGPDEPEDTNPLLELTTAVGEGITFATDGTILFHATHYQTSAIPVFKGVFQVDAVSPTDSVKHLARGTWLMEPDLTKPVIAPAGS